MSAGREIVLGWLSNVTMVVPGWRSGTNSSGVAPRRANDGSKSVLPSAVCKRSATVCGADHGSDSPSKNSPTLTPTRATLPTVSGVVTGTSQNSCACAAPVQHNADSTHSARRGKSLKNRMVSDQKKVVGAIVRNASNASNSKNKSLTARTSSAPPRLHATMGVSAPSIASTAPVT